MFPTERVSTSTFDSLLKMIETHTIFMSDAYVSQCPVSIQLAIAMYHFGHDGNASSVEAVAQWAGVSVGTFFNCTLLQILSLLVSLIVSSYYAILLSVGLTHALNTVSSHVLFIVSYVVLLSFQILFRLFICLSTQYI